ncbi:MAG: aminodeoxychorismate/anthranilate synthase component II [Saprospiraceae bacterium]|nr:aminodeoxychorismate/anthranilate synthase component II [Saprospiraceae bacterium]
MKVLVLDNYDSFTYNLVQYIQEILEQKIDVFRNDEIDLDAIETYDFIILSPGPGLPKDAGIMPALIKRYAPTKTILGVCLGHQAIGEAFGASLENLAHVFHGVETPVEVVAEDEPLFANMPTTFQAGRYHSWVVAKQDLPSELEITAVDEDGVIMAMRHKEFDVRGVQFHPESIMTEFGRKMLENILLARREPVAV